VAFAAGMAKAGRRPIVDIYSTFLQRSYDQIFQEVALQNLPVTFCLDRSGLTGPDGPTHHGVFDNTYLRALPNIVIMAPGDARDVEPMLRFALEHDGPASMRYPKAAVGDVERPACPVERGRSELYRWGADGILIAFGSLFEACVDAAGQLQAEGLEVGVINARFLRPLDEDLLGRAIEDCGFVITVEECTLNGGFGSAVLEFANAAGLPSTHIRRLGIPDRFIEHGERGELLADLGLDADGLVRAVRQMAGRKPVMEQESVP
jgi:1-deoxy-D-xylulose-5-phosphate synthase